MPINKVRFLSLFLTFVFFYGNALANTEKSVVFDKPQPEGMNVGLIEYIQGDTVITEAKLINARANFELKKVITTDNDIPFNAAMPLQHHDKNTGSIQKLPQIIEISGTGNNLSAKLVTTNGNYLSVVKGTQIAGSDYFVKELTMTNVKVSDSKNNLYHLPFSG